MFAYQLFVQVRRVRYKKTYLLKKATKAATATITTPATTGAAKPASKMCECGFFTFLNFGD